MCRELLGEMLRQHRDIFAAFAQGRQRQRDHVEPVIKIGAELPSLDHLRERHIRRRNHADVHLHRATFSEALELALLERTQQLGLKIEGHLADLVQKNGAAVRGFKLARAARYRARERSASVTEELAFEQSLRNRRAVDRDERFVAAVA